MVIFQMLTPAMMMSVGLTGRQLEKLLSSSSSVDSSRKETKSGFSQSCIVSDVLMSNIFAMADL